MSWGSWTQWLLKSLSPDAPRQVEQARSEHDLDFIVDANEYQERCWTWIGCSKRAALPCIEPIDDNVSPTHDCDALAEATVEVEPNEECLEPVVRESEDCQDVATRQCEHEGLAAAAMVEVESTSSGELREVLAMHAEDVASWCRRCDEKSWEWEVRPQANRETRAMQADDIAACSAREAHAEDFAPRCSQELPGKATPSNSEICNEGLGRVIVKAQMACRDIAGAGLLLEHDLLELHVHERSEDAARNFLEHNELKPHVIGRFLVPLTKWLEEQVQDAPPDLASTAYQVECDFSDLLVTGSVV